MSADESRQTFEAESSELLEEMESRLLILENSPGDAESVNSIFRAAHTIKGSSGIIGLDAVQEFTHLVENVLDKVRTGEIKIAGDLVGLLLECRDHISRLIAEGLGLQTELAYTKVEDKTLRERLNSYLGPVPGAESAEAGSAAIVEEEAGEEAGPKAETDNWHISVRFSKDLLKNGMDPIAVLSYLGRIGEFASVATLYDAMPPAAAMDPELLYLGFEIDFKTDADKSMIEDAFEFVREDCHLKILPPKSAIESYINLIHELPEGPTRLGDLLVSGGALTRHELDEALKHQDECAGGGRQLGEILVDEGFVPPAVLDAALKKQSASEAVQREAKTIRVDTEKLDMLLNLVGEMVIAGANIAQHAKRVKDRGLEQSSYILSRLIEEIRDRSMRVRMMPVQDTFTRFNRVVRDIAREKGKDMELIVKGGDTELDKNLLEKIKDPLMHLVRNAADHGIETPVERLVSGKPEKGTITLNAYQDTGDVVIEVGDDGRGLDKSKILEKAVGLGLAPEGSRLSDGEIINLIFQPGFSTAEEVTNISGRGVGMDVVHSNIEALRGSVEVKSEEGMGTKVTIRLPLTLAIIDGFLVGISEASYIVPMDMVVECLDLTEKDKSDAHGRRHFNLRGHILPYIRLRELFGLHTDDAQKHENILVVQYAGERVGFVVDRLYGEAQTVVKNLGHMYRNVKWISGATILGDGTVALILDVPKLVALAKAESE